MLKKGRGVRICVLPMCSLSPSLRPTIQQRNWRDQRPRCPVQIGSLTGVRRTEKIPSLLARCWGWGVFCANERWAGDEVKDFVLFFSFSFFLLLKMLHRVDFLFHRQPTGRLLLSGCEWMRNGYVVWYVTYMYCPSLFLPDRNFIHWMIIFMLFEHLGFGIGDLLCWIELFGWFYSWCESIGPEHSIHIPPHTCTYLSTHAFRTRIHKQLNRIPTHLSRDYVTTAKYHSSSDLLGGNGSASPLSTRGDWYVLMCGSMTGRYRDVFSRLLLAAVSVLHIYKSWLTSYDRGYPLCGGYWGYIIIVCTLLDRTRGKTWPSCIRLWSWRYMDWIQLSVFPFSIGLVYGLWIVLLMALYLWWWMMMRRGLCAPISRTACKRST